MRAEKKTVGRQKKTGVSHQQGRRSGENREMALAKDRTSLRKKISKKKRRKKNWRNEKKTTVAASCEDERSFAGTSEKRGTLAGAKKKALKRRRSRDRIKGSKEAKNSALRLDSQGTKRYSDAVAQGRQKNPMKKGAKKDIGWVKGKTAEKAIKGSKTTGLDSKTEGKDIELPESALRERRGEAEKERTHKQQKRRAKSANKKRKRWRQCRDARMMF